MLKKHKTPKRGRIIAVYREFILAILVLITATIAALAPSMLAVLVAALGTLVLTWVSPAAMLGVLLLATTVGEFGRLTLGSLHLLAIDILAPLTLGIWLIRKISRHEVLQLDRTTGLLLLFWGVAGMSLLLGSSELTGDELHTALLYLVRFVSVSGLLLVARDAARQTPRTSRRLITVLIGTGLLLALSGFVILHYFYDFTQSGLAYEGWDPHIGRITASWLDPNFLAGGFAFILSFAAARFFSLTNWLPRTVVLGLVGIMLIAFLMTYSRSGIVALGMVGVVLGAVRSRGLLVAGALALVVGMAVSSRLAERIGDMVGSIGSLGATSQNVVDPTAELRFLSWQEGGRIFLEHPAFGVGFGAYGAHQHFTSSESHAATGSDWSLLTVAATTGIAGTGVYIALLASLWGDAWRRRRSEAGLSMVAALPALMLHAVFVNALFFPPLMLYLFVLGGLAGVDEKR